MKNIDNFTQSRFTKEELLQDLNVMWDSLIESHPSLFAYTPEEEMLKLVENTKVRIENNMSEKDFFTLIAPLVAKIGCQHTDICPSESFYAYYEKHAKLFPLNVRMIGGKGYVEKNLSSNSSIFDWSEILEINGVKFEDIVAKILPNIETDGYNTTNRHKILEGRFRFFYYIWIGQDESFTVLLKNPIDSQVFEEELTGVTVKEAKSICKMRYSKSSKQKDVPFKLQILNSNTALLSIMDFEDSDDDGETDFTEFIDLSFEEIYAKKIENLIIDLRDNGGGSDGYAIRLYSYLANKDFKFL